MRKRSDASKTPATQRSATRNSAAARRGEERSAVAGNKTPSTVSKAAEEKASEPVREIVSPRRSSLKRETTVVLETPKAKTAAPLLKDATLLPETLQAKAEALSAIPAETCIAGTEKQAASAEIPTGEVEKEAPIVEQFKQGLEKQDPPVEVSVEGTIKETQVQVVTAKTGEETKIQVLETSVTDSGEANLETLPTAPLLIPGESEAGQLDVSGAGEPDVLQTGKADVSGGGEPDVTQAGKPDLIDSGHEGPGRSLPEISRVGIETPALGLSQAPPKDDDQSNELGFTSRSQIGEGETTTQEHESATKALDSVAEEQGVSAGGGEKVMSAKELRLSPARPQGRGGEAEHPQLPALQVVEHAPYIIESSKTALVSGSTQQTEVVEQPQSELIAAAATADLPEPIEGEASTSNMLKDNLLGKIGGASLTSPAVVVDKATGKASNPSNEASLFPHVENTFTNNMVSSVEGETVLIVENLALSSQAPTKLEETLSGTTGGASEVDGLQKEVEMKVNTEGILEAGQDLVGRRVKKKFGRKFFEGKVVEHEPELNWYKVVYEDGDEEELDLKEVRKLLAQAEEDEQSDKKQHGRASGSTNSSKRNVGKARRSRSPAESDDGMEEDSHLQERVRLRNLKKRHVIDTSNDAAIVEAFDSDDQLSATSDESSEEDDDDDDEDVTVGGKRRSRKKPKGKARGKKKRKMEDKSEGEKDFTITQNKLSSRLKEEKSQDTSTEHRIATRRLTGALSTHLTSSDDYSLSSHKKAHTDSQDKLSSEVQSPLGGGAKLVGRKTKKDFGGQFYYGEIIHYDNRVKYYKVRYEDGDEEELEWAELAPTLLPQEKDHPVPTVETSQEAASKSSQARTKDHSKRASTARGKEGAIIPFESGANNGNLASPTRKWRKKVRTASVSVMMKGTDNLNAASTSTATAPEPPPRPLAAARFASASDADVFEYFGWGEAVNFDRSKCPELRATRLLPTSSPVVHLAVSRHHLAALTAAGQVWVWRCKHGNVHTRCNEWEHVASLDSRKVILVDISGPDVDRASAGYQPEQEDQVPDPFYLAAVCSNGEDIILQGSQPHESVHTYQYDGEPQHPGLREGVLQSNPDWLENMGRIVQVSVGMVEAADESPFVGYITDMDCVFIRSATRDFMEEVNLVTGYTGKPLKIQCGRVYHAIILTDDGRAWTWGQGYYPGSNLHSSAGFTSKWASPFSVCQPAVGTLVGRKVVDVGCYGEDFIALTNDGDVHQWTHALPNPAAGVYNVPATPVYGQRPSIGSGDKLKQVTIGAGICAGISETGKVHTWRTSLKGGFVGMVGGEREAMTPLGRDEGTETAILTLGTRGATKVMCVAGSLLVVVKRKYRGRRGGKRKLDASAMKGKSPEDEAMGDGQD